jgi:hypothetical protein
MVVHSHPELLRFFVKHNYAIRHVLNAVVTPRSSRQCERYNKAIVTRSLGHSCKKITECVNKCINSTPVKSVLDYQCPSC